MTELRHLRYFIAVAGSARSFTGNPYDDHVLAEQLEQAAMTEDTEGKPTQG